MEEELESLKENGTFEITMRPEGKNSVEGKWVYTRKKTQVLKHLRPDIMLQNDIARCTNS